MKRNKTNFNLKNNFSNMYPLGDMVKLRVKTNKTHGTANRSIECEQLLFGFFFIYIASHPP
ncbi:hypothetical protein T12_10771 [Trichinella patagoniensis]|uniref:Uncharacterized protein n=1 Tax=Trichinella patagoniensis TaxID=990121 RepID=A0A0V0ZG55_9BILA|nr:hypothetical protein T12_10771 [Trichinella patagoniensis]